MDRQDGRQDFLTAIMSSKDHGLTLNPDAILSNAAGLTSVFNPMCMSLSLILQVV